MENETFVVGQAQHGSDEAFTALVEAYQVHVYNLCYRMLGDAASAEDAAQETFLRAYQHLQRYDGRRPFATWLLSIAAHYCIDRLRRRKFHFASLEGEEVGDGQELQDANAPSPEGEAIRREEREGMQRLLAHLDPVDRAAIIMRYWNESSEVEIAEALRLTVSAVKSRLHRARRELAGLWPDSSPRLQHERKPHESPAF